ncbi:PPOX class F420-dependent oxidoreductase [Actinoallomurus bryophytorum]|uniref:PPOX class probable F420-dependent enzyme n=1 Tax=Actinoallomurus bryophytorum TaxID=1490222 RepID=A0A543BZU4_9ACTN|nr:PPOX class F420-dependent oxidoreductase [Actinoallomurus bryophytorum]TQL90325.1 PPOX class probable F420-dependent enzyme [Actinoallomurus bryophytorum]
MSGLTDEAKALLAEAIPGWATTVRPDGSLHSTVVWVDVEGDDVIFNTAIGRAKEKHLRADPRVSVSVAHPRDAFRFVSVSGIARLEEEGAADVFDQLARKYLGIADHPHRSGAGERITIRVRPDRVIFKPGGQG